MTTTPGTRTGKGLSLLCFDGGGVRGLSSLYILKRLMETLDPENPPQPCDVFDMIGGTSTGGVIALMLGRLGMTVEQCINAYVRIMPSVFEKKKHRFSLGGKLQGRFNGDGLKTAVEDILREHQFSPNELLRDPSSKCKAFVCVTRKEGLTNTVLSTYPSPRRDRELYTHTLLWEAARATSAATTFFDPIEIRGESFVDGAFGSNNPIGEMWTEARDLWSDGSPEWRLEDNLSCVVSIGTGVPAFGQLEESARGIMKTLKKIVTDCEKTAEDFERHQRALDGRYFRFNVDRGLEDVGLEEFKRQNQIIAATRQYLEREVLLQRVKQFSMAILAKSWSLRICDLVSDTADQAARDYQALTETNDKFSPDLAWMLHTNVCDNWIKKGSSHGIILQAENAHLSDCLLAKLPDALSNLLHDNYAPGHMRLAYVDCRRYLEQDSKETVNRHAGGHMHSESAKKDAWSPVDTDALLLTLVCQWISLECTMHEMANLLQDGSHTFQNGSELLKAAVAAKFMTMGTTQKRHPSVSTAFLVLVDHAELADCVDLSYRLAKLGSNLQERRSGLHYRFVLNISEPHPQEASLMNFPRITSQTEIEECIESLETPFVTKREAQIMQAEAKTFNWLPRHESFRHWRTDGGILWIRGKPGSGKSTLAKHVLGHLKAWYQHSDSGELIKRALVTSWFYSTKMSTSNMSHDIMLRSLIYSLLEQDHSLFCSHKALYESLRKSSTHWQWSINNLLEFLKLIAEDESGPEVIGVIDALDESDEQVVDRSRDELLRQLLTITSEEISRLRLIILSRPELPFQKAFRDCEQIYLERENASDIERVVQAGLARLHSQITTGRAQPDSENTRIETPKLRRKKQTSKQIQVTSSAMSTMRQAPFQAVLVSEFAEMKKYLLENASGVFLWIALVLRELKQIAQGLPSIHDLKMALYALPSDLNNFYQMIVERIRAQEVRRKARTILLWTIGIMEMQQLTLAMLFEAMKIPNDYDIEQLLASDIDPLLGHQLIFQDWESFALTVYDACGGLIEVLPNGGPVKPLEEYDEDEFNGEWIVTLLHRTVQQFLTESFLAVDLHIAPDLPKSTVSSGLNLYLQLYLPLFRASFVPEPSSLPIHDHSPIHSKYAGLPERLAKVRDDSQKRSSTNTSSPKPDDLAASSGEARDDRTACSSLFGDCDFVTYLEDKQLLPLALERLPSQWNETGDPSLARYRSVLHHEATNGMHPWTQWVQLIPGRSFRVVGEKRLRNALRIIEQLLSMKRDPFSIRSSRYPFQQILKYEMLGAMLLNISHEGPAYMVSDLSRAYLPESSDVYELVQQCNHNGFRKLADHLTWGSWQTRDLDYAERNALEEKIGIYDHSVIALPYDHEPYSLQDLNPCVLRILRMAWKGGRGWKTSLPLGPSNSSSSSSSSSPWFRFLTLAHQFRI